MRKIYTPRGENSCYTVSAQRIIVQDSSHESPELRAVKSELIELLLRGSRRWTRGRCGLGIIAIPWPRTTKSPVIDPREQWRSTAESLIHPGFAIDRKSWRKKRWLFGGFFFYTNYTSVSRIYKYFTDLNLIVFDRFVRYHKERRERERRKYIKRVVYKKRDILIEMWYKRSTVKICHFIFNSLDWQYPIDYGNNLVDSIGNSIGIE